MSQGPCSSVLLGEECELERRLHLGEHLTNGKLLIGEERLAQRCGDGHGACRNANHLATA